MAEDAWPYESGQFAAKPPKNIEEAEHYKISQAQLVRNVTELKGALQTFGPVISGMSVYESFISANATKTGHISMPVPREKLVGGIAVCFVGFDDTKQLLKFRNSWGKNWGDNGYGYISYEYAERLIGDSWAIGMK